LDRLPGAGPLRLRAKAALSPLRACPAHRGIRGERDGSSRAEPDATVKQYLAGTS